MQQKLDIKKFKEIKQKLKKIIDEIRQIAKLKQIPIEKIKEYIKEYISIQKQLLSYDLSDIPYFEWENIRIIYYENDFPDFSKTKANIDFSILNYTRNTNYKGCKIRNFEKINRVVESENFDESIVKANPQFFLSNSVNSQIKKKIYNCKLTIDDLLNLNLIELEELSTKKIVNNFEEHTKELIDLMGLKKTIELYNYSKEDYKSVYDIVKYLTKHVVNYDRIMLEQQLKSCSINSIKELVLKFLEKNIFEYGIGEIKIENLPPEFLEKNKKLLLLETNTSKDLRERFYSRKLTIDDVIYNSKLFKNISILTFMDKNSKYYQCFEKIAETLNINSLTEILEQNPEHINYIIKGNLTDEFVSYANNIIINKRDMLESIYRNYMLEEKRYSMDDRRYNKKLYRQHKEELEHMERLYRYEKLTREIDRFIHDPDEIIDSFFSNFDKIKNKEQLLLYHPYIFELKNNQRIVIDLLGLNNIQKFELETGFFSHQSKEDSNSLEFFHLVVDFLNSYEINQQALLSNNIDFKNGTLIYEDFVNEFAKLLDMMRKHKMFTENMNYDWMKGKFRNNHQEIFMDKNAPKILKRKFYSGPMTMEDIEIQEYHQYLLDKKVSNTIELTMKLDISIPKENSNEDSKDEKTSLDFCEEYIKRYGTKKFYKLIEKYGELLQNIKIDSYNNEIESEQEIEKQVRKAIYNKINSINNLKLDYVFLESIPEFKNEYPDIFIDFESITTLSEEEKTKLKALYNRRELTESELFLYTSITPFLEDKNLPVIFSMQPYDKHINLINIYGNKKFLELCSRYNYYMNGYPKYLENHKKIIITNDKIYDYNDLTKEISFEQLVELIDEDIAQRCLSGNLIYSPDGASDFLRQNYPELFLDENAPSELKDNFYKFNGLTFLKINQNKKEWLPYLKGKSLYSAIVKRSYDRLTRKYFEVFGIEEGIKLGISKPEIVQKMIDNDKIELMKAWYDKTGGKFIPDIVIMQCFSIEEADKFLTSGSNWSRIMKIEEFSKTAESKDALLKVAYSFGIFDQDPKGMKELIDLLTSIPQIIGQEKNKIIENINKNINKQIKDYNSFFETYLKTGTRPNLEDEKEIYYKLYESLKKEKVNIDYSKDIFTQLYRKNEDSSYTLTFNQQKCPKTASAIRKILSSYEEMNLITPEIAHKLFGGFAMQYNPDFREFFIQNINKILNDPDATKNLSRIQKQFNKIQVFNSNRTLTWDLAVSYIDRTKFENVQIGNEQLAIISSIAGYSQSEFNTLQKIYNYGKQRIYSSIPRIENSFGKYKYEMLRLDDSLAVAIGTLTDCCQELGNAAETCMAHSMVDKNGRVFVIRDEEGNIISQSWVWRNKDVICFDNIEVPDKVFKRAKKINPNDDKEKLTDEIYKIYESAAKELIEADEKKYSELLENRQITQEQYDGLRLGKVTVGLGWNDIADSIKRNSKKDNGNISRPLYFESPVKLLRELWTSDSDIQYILEERNDRKEYNGETIAAHTDTYTEYDDSNFNDKLLLTLNKLELVTKNNPNYLNTSIYNPEKNNKIVSEIAKEYDLISEKTKIVMNPNFAIIYEESEEKIKIGDLFYNTKILEGEEYIDITNNVVIQIRLALEQIAKDKEIDISKLEEGQQKIYEMAVLKNKKTNLENDNRKKK